MGVQEEGTRVEEEFVHKLSVMKLFIYKIFEIIMNLLFIFNFILFNVRLSTLHFKKYLYSL